LPVCSTADMLFSTWGATLCRAVLCCAVLCCAVLCHAVCRSYGDNPEKYIRIGRDALTLGNFVDNPPANNTGNTLPAGVGHWQGLVTRLIAALCWCPPLHVLSTWAGLLHHTLQVKLCGICCCCIPSAPPPPPYYLSELVSYTTHMSCLSHE
jgi:hypothetical protein